jgi:transcriptional regulator with XRE-family HTH domain
MVDREFGRALRRVRMEKGLSQEELGFRAELHRTYISQIERGTKSPSLKTITRLAKALQITASELVRQAERPSQ